MKVIEEVSYSINHTVDLESGETITLEWQGSPQTAKLIVHGPYGEEEEVRSLPSLRQLHSLLGEFIALIDKHDASKTDNKKP